MDKLIHKGEGDTLTDEEVKLFKSAEFRIFCKENLNIYSDDFATIKGWNKFIDYKNEQNERSNDVGINEIRNLVGNIRGVINDNNLEKLVKKRDKGNDWEKFYGVDTGTMAQSVKYVDVNKPKINTDWERMASSFTVN